MLLARASVNIGSRSKSYGSPLPLFALGNAEVIKELKLTDEQRPQFVEVVQEMQKKTELLAKEAQRGGKPEEIGPKLTKIRQEHVGRIEALLSDAQKKQWKEMLGKAVGPGRLICCGVPE